MKVDRHTFGVGGFSFPERSPMAKDDYHVIVYKMLAYLYVQLKAGEDIDPRCLAHDGLLFQINERYWTYIMENLVKSGLVEGLDILRPWGDAVIIDGLRDCRITPAGIEYLCSNSFLAKAKRFLKEAKEITPFV